MSLSNLNIDMDLCILIFYRNCFYFNTVFGVYRVTSFSLFYHFPIYNVTLL
jgi:hypothetical protein